MMNSIQKAAAKAALEAWAKPLIEQASVFTRGAYQAFIDQHGDEIVEAIGNAVVETANVP